MKRHARSIALEALAAATFTSSGYTSVYPVGALGRGHSALPMNDAVVRAQTDGGAGAAMGAGARAILQVGYAVT